MHHRMRKMEKWGLPGILAILLIVIVWSRLIAVADVTKSDSGPTSEVIDESSLFADVATVPLLDGAGRANGDAMIQATVISEDDPTTTSPVSTLDTTVGVVLPDETEGQSLSTFMAQEISVSATVETDPMPVVGDVADDPAVWIHPSNRDLSTIIVTNKSDNGGLHVYDLDGKEIQFLQAGALNNVDIRYDFPLDGELVSLVTASNRTDDSIAVYRVNPATRQLEDVAGSTISAGIVVYGSCMYVSPDTGKYYTFVNSKDGEVEQWELFDSGNGLVEGTMVRSFDVGKITEGCVADDSLGDLYIGEEDVAIWKYGAEPGDGAGRIQVDAAGSGRLVADIEGLTIYKASSTSGYLIASSQGNNTFVIYTREGNNEYVGTFEIVPGNGIDGTTVTDGIDVVSTGLGSAFPNGLFVAQDDNDNEVAEATKRQNVKLVPWESIANGFSPPLTILPAPVPAGTPTPMVYLPLTSQQGKSFSTIPEQSDWKDMGQVLEAGPRGSWDARLYGQISPCSVVKKDGIYYLYYIGADGNRSTDGGPRHRALGVATSTDGVNFVKYAGNPIITYLPHNNQEEGVFSCAATLDENGDVVLYYGALHAKTATATGVDIHIRMRYSSDGLNFVGDTLILMSSGDEFTPLGALRTDAGWYVYYVGPLGGGEGRLKLLSGPTRDNLPNSTNVLAEKFNGGGDPVWLNSTEIVLFLQDKAGGSRAIDVRGADISSLDELSDTVEQYKFQDWGHSTVFFDQELGKWFMYYKLREGNTFHLKVAP